jgi:hypothetical protein
VTVGASPFLSTAPVPRAAPARALALSLVDLEAFDPRPAGGRDERRFCCPLPACSEKPRDRAHQSLGVNVASGLWLCHRCGARGKLTERREVRPWREARRRRALEAFALAPALAPGRAASAAELGPMLAACAPVAGTPGEAYLFGRGIGRDRATAAGVLFAQDWYGRPAVVFVLRDRHGREVAASGRYLDRRHPKTRVAGDRKLGAFATPGAWDAPPGSLGSLGQRGTLVLVEGPCDALALAECDAPAVALVGTAAPAWLPQAAAFRRVVVALDADEAGDRAAAELEASLASFARSVERLRPLAGKDWNDALLADYGGLCDVVEACGLVTAGAVAPAASAAPPDRGSGASPGDAERG